MSDGEHEPRVKLEDEVREMKIEEDTPSGAHMAMVQGGVQDWQEGHAPTDGDVSLQKTTSTPTTQSPVKSGSGTQSPMLKWEREEIIGGDITLKLELGKAPKLARTTSHKVVTRPPQLFSDLPDATSEATRSFQRIPDCIYGAKYLGSTEPALECDCTEEWDTATRTNRACGEDSDCINRATKMECIGDCGCGSGCQNQRFQLKEYANVTVIKTEKKGYGLRTDTDLRANDFIFEYIGEVINEPAFRRRMHQYDQEGIRHFYFMSLSKGEFVDATKKGNLGRFCNHSCNPNCYVDKWVVGDKLRMGIFAERKIQAGEELVFNYNVDRYGADPQPCYCGEPNCTGYIGGKTQTERATKLSNATIEALGIDDGDGWDTAVAKKPRKKKTGEDDEEYVNNVEPKGLEESGVTKVMATLMQCKEKWIAVKLLSRLQRCEDDRVRNRVVKMHGYRILNTALSTWLEDVNVALQILDILNKLPRLTRNKIQDSKIDDTVGKLTSSSDERVRTQSTAILEAWSKLEIAYRIPRIKRDPNAVVAERRLERQDRRESTRERSRSRSKSRSKSADAPRGPTAPTGPRGNVSQRASGFYQGQSRPPFRPRPPFNSLPPGWFEAVAANGTTYYYNATGATTWQRPTLPATAAPPPPPPKVISDQQALQDIIKSIVISKSAAPTERPSASATPADTPKKANKVEKWRSYPEEKKKKLYENTLFPHIKYVMDKFKGKLPKEDIKRFGKEIAKKLVNSDFKRGRVTDPTQITSTQERQVKKYVKDFFDKALAKKREHDKNKAERKARESGGGGTPAGSPPSALVEDEMKELEDGTVMSDNDEVAKAEDPPSATPMENESGMKRKREGGTADDGFADDDQLNQSDRSKKFKETYPPPPPPPPPPNMVEAGLTPGEDVSNSFTAEAFEAVENGAVPQPGEGSPRGFYIRGAANVKQPYTNGRRSPVQFATPPTTGSPDNGDAKREPPSQFEGMNPDRLRQLGLT
ncbi:hypothetical protein BJ546DRAFT_116982 [Cryomyces antarcticus]